MLEQIRSFFLVNSSVRQTFIKNTFWLFVGEVVSRFFKMVLVIYAARILGTAEWGLFAYTFGLASFFIIFSDLGLGNLIIREFTEKSQKKLEYLATTFVIKLIFSIVSFILILTVAPLITKISEIENTLFVISFILLSDSLREFCLAINRALEKMEREAFIRIFTNFLISIFGIFVLFKFPSVNFSYAYLAGSLCGLIATLYILRNYLYNIFNHFSRELIVPVLSFAWPFLIFGGLGIIMSNTDIIMLGWWNTANDIGLYSVAQRLVQFLYVIPSLLSFVILPPLSKLVSENSLNIKNFLEKMLALVFALILPIATGGIILARDIVISVFGEPYETSTLVFQLLLTITVMAFPLLIINNFIMVKNQHKKFVKYSIAGAILNIVLNLLLIPKFGIYGAAAGTAISTFVIRILVLSLAKKIIPFAIFPSIKKIILATILMGFATYVGKYFNINLFVNISFSMLLFLYMLYILKEPLLDEIKSVFRPVNFS